MSEADNLKNTLDDALSYPVLTTESAAATFRSPSARAASSASIGQTVEAALKDVLAWRPNVGDARGFVAALNQAFTQEERDGRSHWRWTPRSYAVQHDMGAVTGAQASLYARAKAALEHALPLLDGLYPLRADDDGEDVSAVRALVRSELGELVDELGQVGGPRVQRVDAQFITLLGRGDTTHPERVAGLLGTLRETLGLERARVKTIAEEENLTNFLIIVDHTLALRSTWRAQRNFFDRSRGGDAFLGTQLVLLSRALAVVAESVSEAYFAMDSVFLGPAERQTTRLKLGGPPLTVAELLGWVERFALEEGPRIIHDAGKDGVFVLRPTLEKLTGLVLAAKDRAEQGRANPTPGFHTPRVQRALGELAGNLELALELTEELRRDPRPEVTRVIPDAGVRGETVTVVVKGVHFREDAAVTLVYPLQGRPERVLEGDRCVVLSDNAVTATLELDEQATLGAWRVVVENRDGGKSQEAAPFTVNAPQEPAKPDVPLELDRVEPDRGHPGQEIRRVRVMGSGFKRGLTLDFGPFIEVLSEPSVRVSHAEVRVAIAADENVYRALEAAEGELPVTVTARNPGGAAYVLKDAFVITLPSSAEAAG